MFTFGPWPLSESGFGLRVPIQGLRDRSRFGLELWVHLDITTSVRLTSFRPRPGGFLGCRMAGFDLGVPGSSKGLGCKKTGN